MASFAVEHIMKNIAPDLSRTQDPREALLAQHEKAMGELVMRFERKEWFEVVDQILTQPPPPLPADPKWVNKAYQKTQPVHVFADSVYEDEEEAQLDKMKKRRQ